MHYGWVVVWLTFVVMLAVAGLRSISGVILVPLELEFEWSRSAISLAFAINLALYGFLGPFAAALMDRVGVRKVMVVGMCILVFGVSLMLVMTEVWQFQILWGLVISVGTGVFLTVLSATVANRWFVKRRGVILGLLVSSTAAGQMVFLPFLASVIGASSWRIAMLIILVILALLIPVIAFFMRDRPEDKGLAPYGMEPGGEPVVQAKKNPIADALNILQICMTSKPFWLLAISFFICGATTNGLIATHFIPFAAICGIPEVQAAGMLAFMGIFNMLGSVGSGWLTDRFDSRWLLFWYYGTRGLSLLILPYALINMNYFLLLAFALFYGLDWVATVPPTVRLATEYFGKERSPVVYGWLFASHQLGSGTAAFMGGVLFEWFDGYTVTFLSAGVTCLIATLFVLSVKRKQPAAAQVLG